MAQGFFSSAMEGGFSLLGRRSVFADAVQGGGQDDGSKPTLAEMAQSAAEAVVSCGAEVLGLEDLKDV